MHIASLNVIGIRNCNKRKNMFTWLNDQKFDIICIQETHCFKDDAFKWEREWKDIGGGASFWKNNCSNAGGIAILLSNTKDTRNVNITCHDNGRIMLMTYLSEELRYVIFNIYAPNIVKERVVFFL